MKRFFSFFVLLITLLSLTACSFQMEQGSGNVLSENRTVSDFDKVSLSGIGELILTQGSEESLKIEAEDNILPYIKTRVEDKTLIIDYAKEKIEKNFIPTKPIKFYLSFKNLSAIELSGTGTIRTVNMTADKLSVQSSGAGSIKLLSLTANSLDINMSGVGSCDLSGKVGEQNVVISGTGSYNAQEFETQKSTITISGAGSATVWADATLNATISGAGTISYYGEPQVTKTISGIGSLKPLGKR